jgi:hypothetical protein
LGLPLLVNAKKLVANIQSELMEAQFILSDGVYNYTALSYRALRGADPAGAPFSFYISQKSMSGGDCQSAGTIFDPFAKRKWIPKTKATSSRESTTVSKR